MAQKINRPRYHLGGPTAPFMCSSYCKQAPPTVNTPPPTVNTPPPTVNTAPPTVNTPPPTVNRASPTVNSAPPSVNVYSRMSEMSSVYSRRRSYLKIL